jgi:ornithine carbamoyltransferase
VVRTNESIAEMEALASQDQMAVINAMSENEHPTQAIADLVTIKEALGDLSNVHLLYMGEGNNSAAALAYAVSMTPKMRLTLVTPEGYGLPDSVLKEADEFARQSGAVIERHHSVDRLPRDVDVVYTSRWQTMGVPKAETNWQEKFEPYRVTAEVMSRVSRSSSAIFLHDLPAVRGAEVVDEVLDGPQSRAFRQAQHKMTSAMAILTWCLAEN